MKTVVVIALTFVAATVAQAEDRKFSAADVPSVRLGRGKIVISNDETHITAFRFFGNVREALVRLQSMRRIATRGFGAMVFDGNARLRSGVPGGFAEIINDAGRTHGVDPRLIAAVARRESAFNASAKSQRGACGLMQLMPATAQFLGVSNVFDARQNVFAGARYLRTLLDTFHGDLDLTLAAYNAGPGAVAKYKGVPPFAETRAYIAAVRAAYEKSL